MLKTQRDIDELALFDWLDLAGPGWTWHLFKTHKALLTIDYTNTVVVTASEESFYERPALRGKIMIHLNAEFQLLQSIPHS